ncbi:3'(2'),5'-bisphosphate nucleotidase CysQ [Salibacter sp.]|uniref:3'(2'),5'-bisphosphate nucleotidase CysQ n=1 Tax=Salibacter sp. TaxID=2010995 RepID=UPI00287033F4|nr:3'(2'),5'-bisphosphate nucleotidase CysQ [Salibacter sp.]MDR9397592.1 3'(2'),5'-bisphosphate nucleotidase CysQ [Salibacter sp.]MDR9487008.1 3'(2'),5'-bisphosphate nucleotidase CysQ [Salibacter sp.]
MTLTNELLQTAIDASIEAGKAILEVYNTDFDVETKDDKSPLTEADKRSHNVIKKYLDKTNIPVLSEEGKHDDFSTRKDWDNLWIVDPLDGTKEFVKRNGEFTVNIALAEGNTPVMGVIYVPVTGDLYFASKDHGAYKVTTKESADVSILIDKADKLPIDQNRDKFVVVGSRSHMSEETEAFINDIKEKHGDVEILSRGSSLKLCMVAEGSADFYPRYAPTMEWDTAAGHAICTAAGFKVTQYETEKPVIYNKENLLNPWFLVHR